jgi:ubiquinone/menaquinone biosynthesis C-methylase UbiE
MDNVEEQQLLDEYIKRDNNFPWNDWKTNIYHPRHPIGHHFQEHNHTILVNSLNRLKVDLTDQKILDVGCGFGYWLRYLVELGATPSNCVGIDLSSHRIEIANQKNPEIKWQNQSIENLPFENEIFDFILQTVVFSSIINPLIRKNCAAEMDRVLKKGGVIFWIDLFNVSSDKLVCFSKSDVLTLFPNFEIVENKKVHPKYFRKLTGRNAWLADVINHFTNLACESMLYVMRKPNAAK